MAGAVDHVFFILSSAQISASKLGDLYFTLASWLLNYFNIKCTNQKTKLQAGCVFAAGAIAILFLTTSNGTSSSRIRGHLRLIVLDRSSGIMQHCV
jgi:hypothetical protein